MDHPEALLQAWANFYVIIGSSAAALTGLMFVVITLISGSGRSTRSHEGTATFSTPTVVHFGAALLVAAIMSAPWHAFRYPRLLLGLCGLYGIVYILRIADRMRRVPAYTADTEDWVWHTLLPLVSYALIFAGALTLTAFPNTAPYAFAAAVVLMLFIGIHNAWDIVTFMTVDVEKQDESAPGKAP